MLGNFEWVGVVYWVLVFFIVGDVDSFIRIGEIKID